MLRKKDELQLPRLFAHIGLRREQGLLIFLSCRTAEVEKYLANIIKAEFSGQFPIREMSLPDCGYIPLQAIAGTPGFSSHTLYIIGDFPFADFYQDPLSLDEQLTRLTDSLNLGREIYSAWDIKTVFILPPEVEDRIALKAADFYHFTHYTAAFNDDAQFHRQIDALPRGGEDKRQRLAFLEKILKKTRKEEDKADICYDIGTIYYELSSPREALSCLEKALEFYRRLKNKKMVAAVLANIGLIYHTLRQWDKALKYMTRSLDIYRKIGHVQGKANILGNIGMVYLSLDQLEKAKEYLTQSLDIHRKIGHLQGEATSLANIGLVYQNLDQPDEALKYMMNALDIFRKIGIYKGEASALSSIGAVYKDLGQTEEALKYVTQSLEITRRIGYIEGEANSLGNIGMIYRDLDQADEARKYLRQSQSIYSQIGIPVPKEFTDALSSLG